MATLNDGSTLTIPNNGVGTFDPKTKGIYSNTPAYWTPDERAAYASEQGPGAGIGLSVNECKIFVEKMLRIPSDGSPTALASWNEVPKGAQYTGTPPAGVPVFFSTGHPAGHVALSAGDGAVWTTDLAPDGSSVPGQVRLVTIADIQKHWGATYLGWTNQWQNRDVASQTTGNMPSTSADINGSASSQSQGPGLLADLTSPFQTVLSWLKGGFERVAFFAIGGLLLVVAVMRIGS